MPLEHVPLEHVPLEQVRTLLSNGGFSADHWPEISVNDDGVSLAVFLALVGMTSSPAYKKVTPVSTGALTGETLWNPEQEYQEQVADMIGEGPFCKALEGETWVAV